MTAVKGTRTAAVPTENSSLTSCPGTAATLAAAPQTDPAAGSFPQQETLRLRGFPQLTYLLGDSGSVLVTSAGCRDDAAREHGEGMLVQLADFEGIWFGVRPQASCQSGDLVGSLSECPFAGNADQRWYTAEHRGRESTGRWRGSPMAGRSPRPARRWPEATERCVPVCSAADVSRRDLVRCGFSHLSPRVPGGADHHRAHRNLPRPACPSGGASGPRHRRPSPAMRQQRHREQLSSGHEGTARGRRPQLLVTAPPVMDAYLAANSGLADFRDGIEKADGPPEKLGDVVRRKRLQTLWAICHCRCSALLPPMPGGLRAGGVWPPGALRGLCPLTGYQRGALANVETGRQNAPRVFWERCAQALGAGALLTGYDQIQARATAHRQETARRVQTASDAMIRAWQDSWHRDAASYAVQFVALPAPRQADEIHVWLSTPDGNIAHHMIIRRADVTVSQLAVVLGKLLRPDGSEVDDQEQ